MLRPIEPSRIPFFGRLLMSEKSHKYTQYVYTNMHNMYVYSKNTTNPTFASYLHHISFRSLLFRSQTPINFGSAASLALQSLLRCRCPRPWLPSRRRLNHPQHLGPRWVEGVGGRLERWPALFFGLKKSIYTHFEIYKRLAGFLKKTIVIIQKYSGTRWNTSLEHKW